MPIVILVFVSSFVASILSGLISSWRSDKLDYAVVYQMSAMLNVISYSLGFTLMCYFQLAPGYEWGIAFSVLPVLLFSTLIPCPIFSWVVAKLFCKLTGKEYTSNGGVSFGAY